MARAKRTDRAEARRRYRAATAEVTYVEGDNPSKATAVPRTVSTAAIPREARARTAPSRSTGAGPARRPGLLNALRGSYGRVDLVGDIKALLDIALHSKAIWLPSAMILVTGAATLLVGESLGQIGLLLVSLVIQPPPMIIAFLAGMLAPRGAWLVGGLMSTLAAGVYVLYVANLVFAGSPLSGLGITLLGWTYAPTDAQKWALVSSVASSALLTAPLFGIAVGAFAGFYRRFLRMAGPPPQQQQPRRKR